MSKYIRQLGTPLALAAALAVGACAGGDASSDSALAADSALSRDLELAGQDTSAQPQLEDVPAGQQPTTSRPSTSRPSTSRPSTSTPSTPRTTASGNTVASGAGRTEGSVGTIAAGSSINLASNARVCTNTNKVGDRFTARVTAPVQGSNGAVIPAGATATVEVVGLKRSENVNDPVVMTLRVASLTVNGRTVPVSSDVTYAQVDQERSTTKGKDVQKVATGAVIGAIAGQILGKDTKSTVIGAATGAAAGTAVAMGTGNYEGCIPEGGRITIALNSPVQVVAGGE
ncbi:MAG TPA: hypothetical protein VFZ11_02440 [Gemmatimonadaceae bacterium]